MMTSTRMILICLAASATACAHEPEAGEIGGSLNDKAEVELADIPAAVLAAARASRPDLTFASAEREIRNGLIYFDVAGVDEDGAEVELDIMEDGDNWTVVEIQRDIAYEETPETGRAALESNAEGVSPDRIIESDQGDGVIIYEFFERAADGSETKYEVKLDSDGAEFLTEEWAH